MLRHKVKEIVFTSVLTAALLLVLGPLLWIMLKIAWMSGAAMIAATIGIGTLVVLALAIVWDDVLES